MSKKISKVVLVDGGLKGIKVTFEQPSKRSEFNFRDKHTVHYKAPVNDEVKQAVEALLGDLRSLCVINEDLAKEDTWVTEVSCDKDAVKLVGKYKSVGSAEGPLKTPKIDRLSEYAGFEEMLEKVMAVFREVRKYISDKKVVDMSQYVIQFNAGNENFNPGEFMEKTEEERLVEARRLLEKSGAIIIESEPVEDVVEPEVVDGDVGKVINLSEAMIPQSPEFVESAAAPFGG